MGGDSESAFKNTPIQTTVILVGPFYKNFLKIWASDLVGANSLRVGYFYKMVQVIIIQSGPKVSLHTLGLTPTLCIILIRGLYLLLCR